MDIINNSAVKELYSFIVILSSTRFTKNVIQTRLIE